jgi:hypothetical protein
LALLVDFGLVGFFIVEGNLMEERQTQTFHSFHPKTCVSLQKLCKLMRSLSKSHVIMQLANANVVMNDIKCVINLINYIMKQPMGQREIGESKKIHFKAYFVSCVKSKVREDWTGSGSFTDEMKDWCVRVIYVVNYGLDDGPLLKGLFVSRTHSSRK